MLARFTQIDYDREMALVAVIETAGGETQTSADDPALKHLVKRLLAQ